MCFGYFIEDWKYFLCVMMVQKLTLPFFTSVTGVSALEDTQRQRTENLWDFHTPLRVKIQLATFITVTEAGQVWEE